MPTEQELLERIKELELKLQQRDTYLDSMKTLKENYSKLREFMMKKGLDPDSDPEEGWSSIIGQKEEAKKTLEQKLQELTDKFGNLQKAYDNERMEKVNYEIKGKLKNKLTDVIGADEMIELLVLQQKAKLKDDNLFFKKSETEEIPFDDYLTEFKSKNPERFRVQQSSTSSNNKQEFKQNKNDGGSKKTIKYEEFFKLAPNEQEKLLSENVTIENNN